MSADVPPDPADYPAPLPRPSDHPLSDRPTPEQWGFIAHQLGELTPDTVGVRRP